MNDSLSTEQRCKCVEVDAGGSVGFDVKDCPLHNPESPTYIGCNWQDYELRHGICPHCGGEHP